MSASAVAIISVRAVPEHTHEKSSKKLNIAGDSLVAAIGTTSVSNTFAGTLSRTVAAGVPAVTATMK